MTEKASGKVPVTFAKGLLDDVAELLVECKDNPFIGELMGRGLHPELANCRRVRFDIPPTKGSPGFV